MYQCVNIHTEEEDSYSQGILDPTIEQANASPEKHFQSCIAVWF